MSAEAGLGKLVMENTTTQNTTEAEAKEQAKARAEEMKQTRARRQKTGHIRIVVNVVIRVVFFFLFPSIFSQAFSGIKYVCAQFSTGAALELNSFVIALIAVVVFTIVFGRFFCGFACPFGSYGDLLYQIAGWVRRAVLPKDKKKKKRKMLPDRITHAFRFGKYAVLIVVILLCFTANTSIVTAMSPWAVFSRLIAYQLPADGTQLGILFLCLISVGMLLEPRFFCRFLCPLGAIFALLPTAPFSGVKRDKENCLKNCKMCHISCPSRLDLPDVNADDNQMMGECFSCGKCSAACPKQNCASRVTQDDVKGIVWQIVKAVLLLLVFFVLQRI